MMLLAITSPLLGIGLMLVLQVFETWALGGPNRPARQSRQPHHPPTRQAPGGSPHPPTARTDQMRVVDAGRGSLRAGTDPPKGKGGGICCEGQCRGGTTIHQDPLHVMTHRNTFRIGLVETPVDLPRTIHC